MFHLLSISARFLHVHVCDDCKKSRITTLLRSTRFFVQLGVFVCVMDNEAYYKRFRHEINGSVFGETITGRNTCESHKLTVNSLC